MYKEEIIKNLKCLDHELIKLLNKRNVESWFKFDIYIFGDAAMLLSIDARGSTKNIDAVFVEDSCLRQAADVVADKLTLNTQWLNTNIKDSKGYSEELLKFCTPCFTKAILRRCRIYKAPLSLLLCMKLMAFRANSTDDIVDILTIINALEAETGIVNSKFIYSELERYYVNYELSSGAHSFIKSR